LELRGKRPVQVAGEFEAVETGWWNLETVGADGPRALERSRMGVFGSSGRAYARYLKGPRPGPRRTHRLRLVALVGRRLDSTARLG